MTELIIITAITTAVFMIISISYKIGHLDGQLKALKEINKMLVDMKKSVDWKCFQARTKNRRTSDERTLPDGSVRPGGEAI